MAKYRQLYTQFWSDSFVLELTVEEKFFYLYLLTNTKTTQSGIYEMSQRFIEMETGINKANVEKLIKKFCEYNKILYCEDTKEIMLLNWMKYNIPNSPNAIKCVHQELSKVKNKKFVEILFEKSVVAQLDVEKIFEGLIINESLDSGSENGRTTVNYFLKKVDKLPLSFVLDTNSEKISKKIENEETEVSNDYVENKKTVESIEIQTDIYFGRGLQGAYKMLPSNRIRSNKEEVITKKQELINKEEEEEEEVITKKDALSKEEALKHKNNSASDCEGFKNVIKIFEENVHAISPLEYEKILGFTNSVTSKVIIMAIEEAVNYNAKTMKYITKILNSWISNGLRTDYDVKAYQMQWANKKGSYAGQKVKKGGFCDYEQRNYDFDALEKQLLGTA